MYCRVHLETSLLLKPTRICIDHLPLSASPDFQTSEFRKKMHVIIMGNDV